MPRYALSLSEDFPGKLASLQEKCQSNAVATLLVSEYSELTRTLYRNENNSEKLAEFEVERLFNARKLLRFEICRLIY